MSHARRAMCARTRPIPRRRDETGDAPTWKPGRGRTIRCLAVALGVLGARSAEGQPREVKHYGSGAPEAKLMLYYSSTIAFSPLGTPFEPHAAATIVAGVELSYLPHLSAEQRTTGSDKPEATNLAPLFARPRVAVRLPAGFALEGSWIPPVRVFDVKANLLAGALSRSFALP